MIRSKTTLWMCVFSLAFLWFARPAHATSCRGMPGSVTVPAGSAAADFIGVRVSGGNLEYSTDYNCSGAPGCRTWTSLGAESGFTCVIVDTLGDDDDITIEATVSILSSIDGGAGDDFVNVVTSAPSLISGGGGRDVLLGGGGRDIINGGAGVDSIYGAGGSDLIDGAGGRERSLRGGPGYDVILGGGGLDYIYGETENDTLIGQGGWDRYYCNGGSADAVLDSSVGYRSGCETVTSSPAFTLGSFDPPECSYDSGTGVLTCGGSAVDYASPFSTAEGGQTLEFTSVPDGVIGLTLSISDMSVGGETAGVYSITPDATANIEIAVEDIPGTQVHLSAEVASASLDSNTGAFRASLSNVIVDNAGLGSVFLGLLDDPCLNYEIVFLDPQGVLELVTATTGFTQNGSASGFIYLIVTYSETCTVGACNIEGSCEDGLRQEDCEHGGGSYRGDDVPCFDRNIPAVSTWGLTVMGLLTLTAAMVIVMRRRRGAMLFN